MTVLRYKKDGVYHALPVGGGGHTIEDEGTPLTQRASLNFAGAGVTVTDDAGNDATVVTIPGGTGGASNISVGTSPPVSPAVGQLWAKQEDALPYIVHQASGVFSGSSSSMPVPLPPQIKDDDVIVIGVAQERRASGDPFTAPSGYSKTFIDGGNAYGGYGIKTAIFIDTFVSGDSLNPTVTSTNSSGGTTDPFLYFVQVWRGVTVTEVVTGTSTNASVANGPSVTGPVTAGDVLIGFFGWWPNGASGPAGISITGGTSIFATNSGWETAFAAYDLATSSTQPTISVSTSGSQGGFGSFSIHLSADTSSYIYLLHLWDGTQWQPTLNSGVPAEGDLLLDTKVKSANQTNITSIVDITALSSTVNLVAGERYRIEVHTRSYATKSTSNGGYVRGLLTLTDASNNILGVVADSEGYASGAGVVAASQTSTAVFDYTAAATGSFTFKVRGQSVGTDAVLTVVGSATGPSILRVYKVGSALSAVTLPSGGTTGQVLVKDSNTDYDVGWSDGVNASPLLPLAVPVSSHTNDVEFHDVADSTDPTSLGFTWANKGTSNAEILRGLLRFSPGSGSGTRMSLLTIPVPAVGEDFTFETCVVGRNLTTGYSGPAVALIDGDTSTASEVYIIRQSGTNVAAWQVAKFTSYAHAGGVDKGSTVVLDDTIGVLFRIAYVASTKVATAYFWNGCQWAILTASAAHTFTNHPDLIGIGFDTDSAAFNGTFGFRYARFGWTP